MCELAIIKYRYFIIANSHIVHSRTSTITMYCYKVDLSLPLNINESKQLKPGHETRACVTLLGIDNKTIGLRSVVKSVGFAGPIPNILD